MKNLKLLKEGSGAVGVESEVKRYKTREGINRKILEQLGDQILKVNNRL